MKMKRILPVLGIAAAIALGGCASAPATRGYIENPKPVERNISGDPKLETLLDKVSKEIKDSGTFSSRFDSDFKDIHFIIKPGDSKWNGYYNRFKKEIGINPNEKEIAKLLEPYKDRPDFNYLLKIRTNIDIREVDIHEMLHHEWFKYMDEAKRKDFTSEVKKEIFNYEHFPNYPYKNDMERFLSREDSYKDYYGKDFEKYYYGTEAFAYLADFELAMNVAMREDLKTPSNGDKLQEMTREALAWEANKLDRVPPNILQYYKGIINNSFFENAQN